MRETTDRTIDFGPPESELLPDMFNVYPGGDIDWFLLTNVGVLSRARYGQDDTPEPTGSTDEPGLDEYLRILADRHEALASGIPAWKFNGVPGPEAAEIRLWHIEKVWQRYYLEPRLAPLDQELYIEWLAACFVRGQDLRFGNAGPTGPRAVALTDLSLPPLRINAPHIMVPPSVRVEAPGGLGSTVLMTWAGGAAMSSADAAQRLPMDACTARRLMLEHGVDNAEVTAIALRNTAWPGSAA